MISVVRNLFIAMTHANKMDADLRRLHDEDFNISGSYLFNKGLAGGRHLPLPLIVASLNFAGLWAQEEDLRIKKLSYLLQCFQQNKQNE